MQAPSLPEAITASMQEATGGGTEVSTLVRSQQSWAKIRQKVEAKWKVFSLAKNVGGVVSLGTPSWTPPVNKCALSTGESGEK